MPGPRTHKESAAGARPERRPARGIGALATLLVFLVFIGVFAAPGSGSPAFALATVMGALISSGSLAFAWLIGAVGLGRVCAPLLRPIDDHPSRFALQGVLGIAAALTLAHLLGALGLMTRWVAWTPTIVGWALLLDQARGARARRGDYATRPVRIPGLALLGLPALALLTVASAIPAGTLWASEGRGYDVLSYHLMLVRSWIDLGRIEPLTNNVYSFLPSYMEAVYAQLALMGGAGVGGNAPLGLGSGATLVAASMLHAMLAVGTALVIGVQVHRIVLAHTRPVGDAEGEARATRAARMGGAIAGAAFLSVPWTIVVGSLAYNEMAVTLCFAGALIAAFEKPLRPVMRAAIAAFLVGVACSAKPTAAYLVAPATAIALAFSIPARGWIPAALATIPAGLAPMVPWLVRNWLASGNPIFPAGRALFGDAHWSPAQVVRWNAEHYPDLSIVERFTRLFDTSHGVMHSQWSILFPLAVIGAAVAIANKATRRIAIASTLMLLIKALAWLGIGHLQSRFLISAAVPASVLVGLATFVLVRAIRVPRPVAYGLPSAGVLVLAGSSAYIFMTENAGAPDAALIPGVAYMNGSLGEAPTSLTEPGASAFFAARPASYLVNRLARLTGEPSTTILLVGDATPLYLGRVPNHILYATTWDTNPLAAALRSSNGDIAGALASLRDHGVTHMLINFAELDRLQRSGYLDPLLAPDAMLLLVHDHTRIVQRWDQAGIVLVELPARR